MVFGVHQNTNTIFCRIFYFAAALFYVTRLLVLPGAYALNVEVAGLDVDVGIKRAHIGIVGVGSYEYPTLVNCNDNGAVVELRTVAKLDDVSGLYAGFVGLLGIGAYGFVPGEEVVEVLHSCPAWRSVRTVVIVPAHDRGIVHYLAPSVDTLGRKVGAVAS